MSKEDMASTINDLEGLTIGHLFQIIRKVKLSALLSVVGLLTALLGGVFSLGRATQQKEEAVMLNSPFSLSYKSHGFEAYRLILVKDPATIPPSEDKMVLSIRQIESEFSVVEVGKIVANVDKQELSWPWSMFAFREHGIAHAAETNFDIGVHKGDFNFSERFLTSDRVNRFYPDSCVLEYKVDSERRSVYNSFKWIRYIH